VLRLSGSHLTAAFGAAPAGVDTFVHVAQAFAVFRAFLAQARAVSASVPMVRRADKQEMRGCLSHFRTGHHEREMLFPDVFAAEFQAMVHGHG